MVKCTLWALCAFFKGLICWCILPFLNLDELSPLRHKKVQPQSPYPQVSAPDTVCQNILSLLSIGILWIQNYVNQNHVISKLFQIDILLLHQKLFWIDLSRLDVVELNFFKIIIIIFFWGECGVMRHSGYLLPRSLILSHWHYSYSIYLGWKRIPGS